MAIRHSDREVVWVSEHRVKCLSTRVCAVGTPLMSQSCACMGPLRKRASTQSTQMCLYQRASLNAELHVHVHNMMLTKTMHRMCHIDPIF